MAQISVNGEHINYKLNCTGFLSEKLRLWHDWHYYMNCETDSEIITSCVCEGVEINENNLPSKINYVLYRRNHA